MQFLAFTCLCGIASAQTATISDDMFAFDAIDVTATPANGFELQVEGAILSDIYSSDAGSRYGAPAIVPHATGVYAWWQSNYNLTTHTYDQSTPVNSTRTFSWQDCYQGRTGYATSECEHFGESTYPIGTRTLVTTGRWMKG